MFMSNLVNVTMKSSSPSCPMDMREPVVRSLKTWANFALGESLLDIFKVAHMFGLMTFLFATLTVGPDVV